MKYIFLIVLFFLSCKSNFYTKNEVNPKAKYGTFCEKEQIPDWAKKNTFLWVGKPQTVH